MANDQGAAGSSSNVRASSDRRPSDETVVARTEAGPLPKKQGELGWSPDDRPELPTAASELHLPARHPADHSRSPTPGPAPETTTLPTATTNASSASLQSHTSAFKQFLRTSRPLPKVHGVRSSTLLRAAIIAATLIGTIVGWIVTVTRMNSWNNKHNNAEILPAPSMEGNSTSPAMAPMPSDSISQMTSSSLVFIHVAFGAAVLFQMLLLERTVYRLRAERYAFLHPNEIDLSMDGSLVMSLAPWNRPPLPTYAAALGVRGTGDVEDNIIAVPPPPEYGNTRGSTLLLSAHLAARLSSQSHRGSNPTSSFATSNPISLPRPTSQHTLSRPPDAWSRPVSYGEDELRQNARRSLDLEAALSQLEGVRDGVARPEGAVVRR